MRPQKLNTHRRRIDVSLDNESTSLFISNGASRRSIVCDAEGLTRASENEQLIVQSLDQDDGIIARVVFGKLNKKENEEWIERGTRILDISDGMLVLAGGNTFVSSQHSDDDLKEDSEYFQEFLVRPDRYRVNVYTHAPCINGFRMTRRDDWQGFLHYFRTTRPKKKFPGWLIEFANLDGEDIDSIPANKVEEQEQELLEFVIQLEPASDSSTRSDLVDGFILKTESRLPEKCPMGIVPQQLEGSVPILESGFERIDEKLEEARFGDPHDLVQKFKAFADSLYRKDFAEAGSFFIPEIREAAEAYMNLRRNRRSRWEPLEDIWLDRQDAIECLISWRSNFENGGNFFAPDFVDSENYLGDLRCEYGNGRDYAKGKIRRYLIVDAPIVSTSEGPRLAGLYFSS